MKHYTYFLLSFFLLTGLTSAQKKQITLEDIWNGGFRTEGMQSLHSMANGKQYSVLDFDRASRTTSIGIYDYKTLEKVNTLVNSSALSEIEYFTDYTFSTDESKVLLATEVESIFRRSTLGVYYVLDTATHSLTKVADEKIQEPTFSPDGSKVAYGLNNNLFVKDLKTGETTKFTTDGVENKIINGITDWVYEEEFAFVRAFEWNADGSKIAYIKFDETEVPEFSMDMYGTSLYPQQEVFKYPKAGEANSKVSLHIFDLTKNKTADVVLNKAYTDFYIPRVQWTNDANVLSAQYTNRHQNELDLWMIEASNMNATLVLSDKDPAYVDVTDNLTFLEDNSFILSLIHI